MCVRARRARSNYVLPTTPLFLSDADVAGLSVEEEGSGSYGDVVVQEAGRQALDAPLQALLRPCSTYEPEGEPAQADEPGSLPTQQEQQEQQGGWVADGPSAMDAVLGAAVAASEAGGDEMEVEGGGDGGIQDQQPGTPGGSAAPAAVAGVPSIAAVAAAAYGSDQADGLLGGQEQVAAAGVDAAMATDDVGAPATAAAAVGGFAAIMDMDDDNTSRGGGGGGSGE